MIKTIHVKTEEQAQQLVFDQAYNASLDRYRSSFLYRGMPDASFSLNTSLFRNCGSKAPELEMPLLENFIKYVSIEDPTIDESIWNAMIIGQHHGLPTRLLDWTHSPLVALHFANSEDDLRMLSARDSVVWRIDIRELNENLPEPYKAALDNRHTFIFSVKNFTEVCRDIAQYDDDMQDRSLITIEPPSLDQRIVNQYSFFTILPKGISNLEEFLDKYTQNTVKYVIDKDLRWKLRDILDQLNMSERMIYPGIDGLTKWLKRHYYVKD